MLTAQAKNWQWALASQWDSAAKPFPGAAALRRHQPRHDVDDSSAGSAVFDSTSCPADAAVAPTVGVRLPTRPCEQQYRESTALAGWLVAAAPILTTVAPAMLQLLRQQAQQAQQAQQQAQQAAQQQAQQAEQPPQQAEQPPQLAEQPPQPAEQPPPPAEQQQQAGQPPQPATSLGELWAEDGAEPGSEGDQPSGEISMVSYAWIKRVVLTCPALPSRTPRSNLASAAPIGLRRSSPAFDLTIRRAPIPMRCRSLG